MVMIARGETVIFTRTINTQSFVAYGLYTQGGVAPTFVNNGTIQFSSSYTYDPYVVLVETEGSGSLQGSTFENNGTIFLEHKAGYAQGFVSGGGRTAGFLNTGDFLARGSIEAHGLDDWGGPVTNTGHFRVEGGMFAVAIRMETSALIKNSGEISAHVTGQGGAIGIFMPRTSLVPGTHYRIENDGLITATHADPSGGSTGISYGDLVDVPFEIINRGTITADYAIAEYVASTPHGVQQVENTGTINGKIVLGVDDDTLLNSGRINGAVDLGADNDLYDGRLGSVVGMVAGGDGADTLLGGQGFDYLQGNAGADSVSGGAGDDWVVGGKDGDVLSGGTGDDVVYSNLGDDTLDGGDGADWVRGGQGDDSLTGGAGNDWMSGDRGADTISGGAGADLFNTFVGAGIDRILDFSLAQGDRVHLEAAAPYTVTQSGGDTILDLGAGDQVVLVGVSVADSVASWLVVG